MAKDILSVGGFTIIRRIGNGARSTIYLATDEFGRRVVVKRLSETLADDPTWLARFERETKALAKISQCSEQ